MIERFSLVPPQADRSIVEMFEDLAERARNGEITAVAGITINPGGEFAEFFSDNALDNSALSFIGMLRVLQMRFERQIPLE